MQIKTIYAVMILNKEVAKFVMSNYQTGIEFGNYDQEMPIPSPNRTLFCFDSRKEAIDKARELKKKHLTNKYLVCKSKASECVDELMCGCVSLTKKDFII